MMPRRERHLKSLVSGSLRVAHLQAHVAYDAPIKTFTYSWLSARRPLAIKGTSSP